MCIDPARPTPPLILILGLGRAPSPSYSSASPSALSPVVSRKRSSVAKPHDCDPAQKIATSERPCDADDLCRLARPSPRAPGFHLRFRRLSALSSTSTRLAQALAACPRPASCLTLSHVERGHRSSARWAVGTRIKLLSTELADRTRLGAAESVTGSHRRCDTAHSCLRKSRAW